MNWTRGAAPAVRRRSPRLSRRVAVLAIAGLSIAALPAVAGEARTAAQHATAIAESTNPSHANPPVVVGRASPNAFVAAFRPNRQRNLDVNGFALVASVVAVFGAFRRRATLRTGPRVRFDAFFAPRRGPPSLSVAR